jgi:hypothetical protein
MATLLAYWNNRLTIGIAKQYFTFFRQAADRWRVRAGSAVAAAVRH